jgi:hypothetical protein
MAALLSKAVMDDVLKLAQETWVCDYCGQKTTKLSEVCWWCRRENESRLVSK